MNRGTAHCERSVVGTKCAAASENTILHIDCHNSRILLKKKTDCPLELNMNMGKATPKLNSINVCVQVKKEDFSFKSTNRKSSIFIYNFQQ